MNNKIRKIVAIISILLIIVLYISKGFPHFVGKSILELLPMLFTTITVTGIKIGVILGIVVTVKRIYNKRKTNNNKIKCNEDNFDRIKSEVKIKEEIIENKNYTKEFIYAEDNELVKSKSLIKKK